MNDLKIEGTQSTPAISSEYAAGVLEMRGDSYPENSFELFSPVLDWIEAYLRDGDRPLTLNLRLLYLNTSSVKAMMLSPRLESTCTLPPAATAMYCLPPTM